MSRTFDNEYARNRLETLVESYFRTSVEHEIRREDGAVDEGTHSMQMNVLLSKMWDDLLETAGFLRGDRQVGYDALVREAGRRGWDVRPVTGSSGNAVSVVLGTVQFRFECRWGSVSNQVVWDGKRAERALRLRFPYGSAEEFADFTEAFAAFAPQMEPALKGLEMDCQKMWLQKKIADMSCDSLLEEVCATNRILRRGPAGNDPQHLVFWFKAPGRTPFRWECPLAELTSRSTEIPALALQQEKMTSRYNSIWKIIGSGVPRDIYESLVMEEMKNGK